MFEKAGEGISTLNEVFYDLDRFISNNYRGWKRAELMIHLDFGDLFLYGNMLSVRGHQVIVKDGVRVARSRLEPVYLVFESMEKLGGACEYGFIVDSTSIKPPIGDQKCKWKVKLHPGGCEWEGQRFSECGEIHVESEFPAVLKLRPDMAIKVPLRFGAIFLWFKK